MSEEFKKEPVPNLHGETDLFVQYAMVETADWQALSDSAIIMATITDCHGKYGKPIPFNKKIFLAIFCEAMGNIHCCKVKAVIHTKSDLAELFVLNKDGEETGKIIRTSPGRLHKIFQPVYK